MDPQHDPYAADAPSQKKRGNRTLKVLLILLAVGAVCGVICCGVAGWYISRSVTVATTPAAIAEVKDDIADIDVPPEFNPRMGVGFDMGVVDVRIVAYSDDRWTLSMVCMGVPGAEPGDIEPQMRQMLDEQGGETGRRSLNVKSTETRQLTIKGTEEQFEFADATDSETGEDYKQVTGMFDGNNDRVLIIIQVPADEYDEEQIVEMLETIE